MKDIHHIIHILRKHPSARAGVLAKLADRARRELADLPSLDTWDLSRPEGPDAVGGLLYAINQSDDQRKGKWHAAANLLHVCLRVDPDALRDGDWDAIWYWAGYYDAAVGRTARQGQREKAGKKRKRGPELKVRGLVPFSHLGSEQFRDRLDADGALIHEPGDGEEFKITRDGDTITVYSYTADESAEFPDDQLPAYLFRARKTPPKSP